MRKLLNLFWSKKYTFGIPLGIVVIGVIAYMKNWGGFKDMVNKGIEKVKAMFKK